MDERELENLPSLVRLLMLMSWPVRIVVDVPELARAIIYEQALRGAIVGAPADPEAFG
jgi:hypothetical protein